MRINTNKPSLPCCCCCPIWHPPKFINNRGERAAAFAPPTWFLAGAVVVELVDEWLFSSSDAEPVEAAADVGVRCCVCGWPPALMLLLLFIRLSAYCDAGGGGGAKNSGPPAPIDSINVAIAEAVDVGPAGAQNPGNIINGASVERAAGGGCCWCHKNGSAGAVVGQFSVPSKIPFPFPNFPIRSAEFSFFPRFNIAAESNVPLPLLAELFPVVLEFFDAILSYSNTLRLPSIWSRMLMDAGGGGISAIPIGCIADGIPKKLLLVGVCASACCKFCWPALFAAAAAAAAANVLPNDVENSCCICRIERMMSACWEFTIPTPFLPIADAPNG